MTDKQKNLITRAVTGVLFVTIMVAGFLSPHYMVLLFATITGLTLWEFTTLVSQMEHVNINRFISTVAGVYFFVALAGQRLGFVEGFSVFVPYILTIIYLFLSELYLKNENPILNWAYTMLGQMYIVLPISMINILAFQHDLNGQTTIDLLLPLSVFIFLWTNDTGAYCSGSLFGKHKLFPRISPAKTWEGSIGGGILVIAVAVLIGYFTGKDGNVNMLTIPQWIGLGIVVAVFGTWGDLVESLFKRTLGVKDSGNILPGHGGMLDRFDSSLMALPAAVVYLYALTIF
ncbi:phosphatidate cytidylyltransferase [Prevotella brunnea]|uniref:Phosphatidate cytidylyltransferase n=1 Tax=Prevotella brunnea TaxID=2508867 RepID=A0A5C8GN54_9BACT|nr:phosphatidate cytidylyltransferase [Prevotella brunnea]MDR0185882.1 phosphatidate cytidylyltransferase [Prevotella brunnea]TXJ63328.1 phosphatidate cytidylyltransferase [Prevotella brunnea]